MPRLDPKDTERIVRENPRGRQSLTSAAAGERGGADMAGPMVHLAKLPCPLCRGGRHEHRSPYGCGRMQGALGMCACQAPVTLKICGRCKRPIADEPRVSSGEFVHRECPR